MNTNSVINQRGSVKTVKEFEEILKLYKIKNPEKYKLKKESGDFARFEKTLSKGKPVVVKEEPLVEKTFIEQEEPKKVEETKETKEKKVEKK